MHVVDIQLAPLYVTMASGLERPYCLNYMNSSGELASTRFTYDKKGRNDQSFYQNITGGSASKNMQEFDKQNRIIRKSRTYNDGLTSVETFQYDSEGHLIKETFEDSNDQKGSATYTYDQNGNAISMDCKGFKGWLTGEIHFTFDRDGKRLEGTLFKSGKSCGDISYQYDSRGNLLQEHWVLEDDWTQTFRYVYESIPGK